mmetsp:Transcript_97113/g.270209  ORF Transcript_97113/g.270209 Transcript_97113/m.270209 type:complete len:353 (+) Transcript_97113:69-1127(+)
MEGPMWLLDAIALTDGTVGGVAELLARLLPKLPKRQQPNWIKNKTKKELKQALVRIISEAYTSCGVMQDYMVRQQEKGDDMEDIWYNVEPFMEEMSRPWGGDEDEGVLQALQALEALEAHGEGQDLLQSGPEVVRSQKQLLAIRKFADVVKLQLQERLRAREDEDGRPEQVPSVGQLPEPATQEAHLPAVAPLPEQPAEAPRPEEAPLEASRDQPTIDIQEPLLLLGTPNGWDFEEARRRHRLAFYKTRRSSASVQESKVRVEVHADGMEFCIASADQPERCVLLPSGSGPRDLDETDKNRVQAQLAAGAPVLEEARARSFLIEGTGVSGLVDVRVALSRDGDPLVWFTEAE